MILDYSHSRSSPVIWFVLLLSDSFLCYLIHSCVIFGRPRHYGRVELLQQGQCDLQSLKLFTLWPFPEKHCHLCLRKGMELERSHRIEKALPSFVHSEWSVATWRGNMKCGSHAWTSERLYFYVAASSLMLAGTQDLALNLPSTPYPELSHILNLKEPAVIWQCL